MTAIEVLSAGALTTVQDWPGRLGLWEVGVPPSGPMDDRALRAGNRLVGNPEGAAALEVTLRGPRLRFTGPATVAVTGAPFAVELDGVAVSQWTAMEVGPGSVLRLGTLRGAGMRAYVCVRGGIDVAPVMGSRSAFVPGAIGPARLGDGDVLPVGAVAGPGPGLRLHAPIPELGNAWTLRLACGPHGAPDVFTEDGIDALFGATWRVHHHSDRTGVRLVGPMPQFARADGGDAGLHPSNILDSAYGVGTVMLAGDTAVVVGPDGPSLGGFAAIGQVVREDLWQLGQVRAGDAVRLVPVEAGAAGAHRPLARAVSPVLDVPLDTEHGPLTLRRAGERALLVEFGDTAIDLRSRVRAHALQLALRDAGVPGVLDLTPGVRSLHVQFDVDRTSTAAVADAVRALLASLPAPEDTAVEGRVVRLPLAWRHSQAMLAVERYTASVRPDAPWCPDNIEFIRRINGLADEGAVRAIVYDASYLVLGLGDVYLGAPVAVPLDPRHRLVTTKYSPARTWTPPNAVGIGGAFLCVYGMEGPGGYQLVGRTVPIWHDADTPPWRLRHFDQLRFVDVDEDELEDLRARSHAGTWAPETEPVTFSLAEHERFLHAHADSIAAFRAHRGAAFAQERDAWAAAAAPREAA